MGEIMETQRPEKNVELNSKKIRGFISFSQNGIKIPENLSSLVIEGKITDLIARKILFQEGNGYFFKFDEKYYLKTFHSLRDQKYTIKFVGNRKYSIGSDSLRWSQMVYFPILKFEKLDYSEYKEILQILEDFNVVSKSEIKKAEDAANIKNHAMLTYRYVYLAALTGIALFVGIALRDYLYGNERIILVIYNIIIGGGFAFSMLMFILVSFQKDPSNIEKLRRHLVLQYIVGIFVVLVISIVFIFALTR
jgi:hypothetical protein